MNYKKKSNNQNWTEEDMRMAIEDIKSKKCSIYKASKQYNIPKTTLIQHLSNPNKTHCVGRPTTLTSSQEKEIVETCQIFVEWGFGLTKPDIINVIADYLHATKNQIHSKTVYYLVMIGFSKRNPELVKPKPQALQMV